MTKYLSYQELESLGIDIGCATCHYCSGQGCSHLKSEKFENHTSMSKCPGYLISLDDYRVALAKLERTRREQKEEQNQEQQIPSFKMRL